MRFFLILLVLMLMVNAGQSASFVPETGESVVVVYNTEMPGSKDVADHYAERRQVPVNQILGLKLPIIEDMTRAQYRDELEKPLARFLNENKLLVLEPDTASTNQGWMKLKEGEVHYVVLCYGVPLRIAEDGSLKEKGAEKVAQIFRVNGAAVDSELCLLPCPDSHRRITGWIPNPFYGTTNASLLQPSHGLLIVTRLDGPTAAIARGLVDKAMDAERDGLWGRAYFDKRGVPKSDPGRQGDDWITTAATDAHKYGFETIVDESSEVFPAGFPLSQIALYAGWYERNVSGAFAQPKVEFMPGAFAYHLHSYSAQTLRSTTNNWCGPLLAAGATATMGCVNEPYLQFTPNLGVFFSRWLMGFTFGQAAYASQAAFSWQTTVIGDPLYRPFGQNPQKLHQSLMARRSPMLQWSHLRVVNLSLVHGLAPEKLVAYIQDVDPIRQSPVLTEKLGDLYQMEGKPELAIQSWEQVLRLDPTPQQRVRLTLRLGEKLAAGGREKDALFLYDNFLTANPTYPDALTLYERMERMAENLHKTSDAIHYHQEIERLTAPPAK